MQAALDWFAVRYFGSDDKQAHRNSTDFILKIALSHPKTILNWINAHYRYRDAEGFMEDDSLLAARIMECKEYKIQKNPKPCLASPLPNVESAKNIAKEIKCLPKKERPQAIETILLAARLAAQD